MPDFQKNDEYNINSLKENNIENQLDSNNCKYKFFYLTYIPNSTENQNNSGSHLEFITINIDINKLFVKEDEIKNEIRDIKGKMISIAISSFDDNLKSAITKCKSEGYLIAFEMNNKNSVSVNLSSTNTIISNSKMFICAYYNGNNLSNYETIKENFKIDQKIDNNHFFLNLDEFRMIRDVNPITKILDNINKDYFLNYGIKYFSISTFNSIKSYFDSEKKVMMLVNYGESLILDICKNRKIQVKHLDLFYIIKLITSEESYIRLKDVLIENYHPSLESFSAVLESFYMLKKLSKIKFLNCDLTPNKCIKIFDLICHNFNIKEFIFYNNKLDFDCIQILIEALNYLSLRPECRSMNIVFNDNLLPQSQKNLIKLKSLKLDFVLKSKKLYFVKMFDSIAISHIFFEKIFNALESHAFEIDNEAYFISKIDLSSEYVIDKSICLCEILNLSFNVIKNSEYLINTIKIMPILCEIMLVECELNNDFVSKLFEVLALNPLITYIDLSNNYITGDVMGSILKFINAKDKFIAHIINNREEHANENKHTKQKSISAVFKKVYTVTKLATKENENTNLIEFIDTYELKIILNNNLIGLNKSSNPGLAQFFQDIVINKMSVSLFLDNNLISNKIFQSFCKSLSKRNFKKISFKSNYLTDEIVSFLSKNLNVKMNLEELDLSDNLISKRIIISILSNFKSIFQELNYQKEFKIRIDELHKFNVIKRKIMSELESNATKLKKIEENSNFETPTEFDYNSIKYQFIIENLSFTTNEEVLNLENEEKVKNKIDGKVNEIDDINNPLYDLNSYHDKDQKENEINNELVKKNEDRLGLNESYNQFQLKPKKQISYDEAFKYLILDNKINK